MKMILLLGLLVIFSAIADDPAGCFKIENNQCESTPKTGTTCNEQNAYDNQPSCDTALSRRSSRTQGGQGQNGQNSIGMNCYNSLKAARATWGQAYSAYKSATVEAVKATAKTALAQAYGPLAGEDDCRSLEVMAQAVGTPSLTAADSTRTIDGRATCVQKGGYTADYDSCKSTAGAYNAIVALEKLMLTEQAQRAQSNQQNLQAKAAAQVASGDGQNAAFDATIADTSFKKGLDEEQVMAYSAAVALLGTKLATWQKSSTDSLEKLCGSKKIFPDGVTTSADLEKIAKGETDSALSAEQISKFLPSAFTECKKGVDKANDYDSREVIANNSAKSAFALALTEFFQKAAAAKMAADRLKAISNAVAAAKTATATGATGTAGLVDCKATPTAPACIKIGDRVNATGISQGDFSVGDGMGNNSFDTGATTAGATGTEEAGTGPTANVGNMTSPYNDQAKAANKILNPANAASITPTGGSGGGGGGAGGGLGGGGVSLGNDLNGADKNGNKAKDIEANKLAGNYGSGGGKGFSALAATKEDNPFASLFDSKSQGGLEEDRSIASDTGAADSGIFQKISRRYNQVQSEKRIEAGGLE